jgi:hypothetical protein
MDQIQKFSSYHYSRSATKNWAQKEKKLISLPSTRLGTRQRMSLQEIAKKILCQAPNNRHSAKFDGWITAVT